jgi:hypothetical protein
MKTKPIKKMTAFTLLKTATENSGRTCTLPLAAGALVIARGADGEASYYMETRKGIRVHVDEGLARRIFRDHVFDDDVRTVIRLLTEEGRIAVDCDDLEHGKKTMTAWEALDKALTPLPRPLFFSRTDYSVELT